VPAGSAAERRRFLLRHAAFVAIAVAALLSFAGTFQHGLWTPDEPREAEIGREMLLSHWSAVPTLGGTPFLEKPPLYVWIMAAAFRAFGVSPGVARLPGTLFSIGAAWFAYLMARRAGGRLAGVAAAVVLVTCNEFAEWSHRSVNDTALTFFVAAGHWAFLVARDEHRLGRRTWALAAAGLCAGLAFLTKGVIGPVLLGGPPILAAAFAREWSFVRSALPRAALWCGVFVTAIGLPWVLALAASAGWDAVDEVLVRNTIGRVVGAAGDNAFYAHDAPPWYYLTGFSQGLLPWILAVPALLAGGTLARTWRGGRARHLALLALCGVLLLSVPSGKRALYALPLYPATAAVLGTWLSRVGTPRGGRFDRVTAATLVGLVALVAAAAAWLTGGGALPAGSASEKLAAFRSFHADVLAAVAAACALAAVACAWFAYRALRRSPAAAARGAATAMAAAFLVGHAAGRPLLDGPLNNMEDGARALAAAVPQDEEMLALHPEETTRGIVPFTTGRTIRAFDRARDVPGELGRPPFSFVLVETVSEKHVGPAMRARLTLERVVTLKPGHDVRVYRYDPPPADGTATIRR
jgi:4-amino-4-deoxy-L-arabinose transferase-like glycosyltransferase